MSLNETSRVLPSFRREIAQIDVSISRTRDFISRHDTVFRERHPDTNELLYDEATYNSELYSQLGHAAETLVSATHFLVKQENERARTLSDISPVQAALLTRIPDMSWYRAEKPQYRDLAIDKSHPLHNESVVPLSEYRVNSRSYYSRPNNATGEAVPGVKPEVFVRMTVAEKLQWVNDRLKSPEITEFFGGEVELFVEEGWRDPRLQQYLHDEVIPKLIRGELALERPELGPEALEEMVQKMADAKIAWSPVGENDSPSPHGTGAAVDLTLRYVDTGERIYFGRGPAQMVNRTDPDTFEHHPPESEIDQMAAQNLYALNAIMTGAAFGEETGFVPNPTEFWHWSIGDQLNYIVSGVDPYYGFAPMNGVTTYEPAV